MTTIHVDSLLGIIRALGFDPDNVCFVEIEGPRTVRVTTIDRDENGHAVVVDGRPATTVHGVDVVGQPTRQAAKAEPIDPHDGVDEDPELCTPAEADGRAADEVWRRGL